MTRDERLDRIAKLAELAARVDSELNALKHFERTERRSQANRQKVAACGTDGGYYRHRRTLGTPPCAACRMAHADVERERARRRKLVMT